MAKKASKAAVEAVDIDTSDKPGGLGIDEGIIVSTFFLLVIAIALVVVASKDYGP
ncbi:MAG TPA: hypothetical protein VFT55_17850 [Planctomycetota bacterium]|nr:hypothetical protein [Planctomycetota bacterium]